MWEMLLGVLNSHSLQYSCQKAMCSCMQCTGVQWF